MVGAGDSSFSDYAEVVDGLFIGAHPEPENPFDLGATVVVCLASGTSAPLVPQNGLLVHWPIKDGPVPEPETLRCVAKLIDTRVRSGEIVFVHCQAGMNRSALVVARVLMEQGMTAEQAIDRVRERRKGSLSDEYADWLRSEEGLDLGHLPHPRHSHREGGFPWLRDPLPSADRAGSWIPRSGVPILVPMARRFPSVLLVAILAFACASRGSGPAAERADGSGGPIAFVASEPKPPPTEIVSDTPIRPDPSDIYTVGADGEGLRRITTDGDPKGPLAWSPDGQTLAYTASPIGTRSAQLWLVDPSGADAHMVCEGCDGALKFSGPDASYFAPYDWLPREIAWSPSGHWIAATAAGGGLALIQPSSGDVTKFPSGEVFGMSWSPDGSSIAFTVQDEGVFVADVGSGHVRLIAKTARKFVNAVAWSPDGSEIAYADTDTGKSDIRQGLVAVDPSGNDPRVLMDARASFGIYDLEWSPDGSRLAAMFHPIEPPTAGLLTMAADGSDVRNVAICENGGDKDGLCPPNDAPVVWSPDGAHLMFDNYVGSGHELTVVATDGSSVPVSGSLVPGYCFVWQPG